MLRFRLPGRALGGDAFQIAWGITKIMLKLGALPGTTRRRLAPLRRSLVNQSQERAHADTCRLASPSLTEECTRTTAALALACACVRVSVYVCMYVCVWIDAEHACVCVLWGGRRPTQGLGPGGRGHRDARRVAPAARRRRADDHGEHRSQAAVLAFHTAWQFPSWWFKLKSYGT